MQNNNGNEKKKSVGALAVPIILTAAAIFIAVCLFSNGDGILSRGIGMTLKGLLSYAAYTVSPLLLIHALTYKGDVSEKRLGARIGFSLTALLSFAICEYAIGSIGSSAVFNPGIAFTNASAGGFIGTVLGFVFTSLLGGVGSLVLVGTVLAVYSAFFFAGRMGKFGKGVLKVGSAVASVFVKAKAGIDTSIENEKRAKAQKAHEEHVIKSNELMDDPFFNESAGVDKIKIDDGKNAPPAVEETSPKEEKKRRPRGGPVNIELSVGVPEEPAQKEPEETVEAEEAEAIAETPSPSSRDDSAESVFTKDFDPLNFATEERNAIRLNSRAPIEEELDDLTRLEIKQNTPKTEQDKLREKYNKKREELLAAQKERLERTRNAQNAQAPAAAPSPVTGVGDPTVAYAAASEAAPINAAATETAFTAGGDVYVPSSAQASAYTAPKTVEFTITAEPKSYTAPATSNQAPVNEAAHVATSAEGESAEDIAKAISEKLARTTPGYARSANELKTYTREVNPESDLYSPAQYPMTEASEEAGGEALEFDFTDKADTVVSATPSPAVTDSEGVAAAASNTEEPSPAAAAAIPTATEADEGESLPTETSVETDAPAPILTENADVDSAHVFDGDGAVNYITFDDNECDVDLTESESFDNGDKTEDEAPAVTGETPENADGSADAQLSDGITDEAPAHDGDGARSSYERAAIFAAGLTDFTASVDHGQIAEEPVFKPYTPPAATAYASSENAEDTTLKAQRTMLPPTPSLNTDAIAFGVAASVGTAAAAEAGSAAASIGTAGVAEAGSAIASSGTEAAIEAGGTAALNTAAATVTASAEDTVKAVDNSSSHTVAFSGDSEATVVIARNATEDDTEASPPSFTEILAQTDENSASHTSDVIWTSAELPADGDAETVASESALPEFTPTATGAGPEDGEDDTVTEKPEEDDGELVEIPPEDQNPEVIAMRRIFGLDDEESSENGGEVLRGEDAAAYANATVSSETDPTPAPDSDTSADETEGGEDLPPFDSPTVIPAPTQAPPAAPLAVTPYKEEKKKPDFSNFEFPSIDLLAKEESNINENIQAEIQENADRLIETLSSFNVTASIKGVDRGPRITRYEVVPAKGVKVSSILNLQDDIALNLAAGAIRMEAPIPGKSAVGIEIPNKTSSIVRLRDLIETDDFRSNKSKTAVCIGRDVAGQPVFGDIAKMPHLLIAGATGMGKSVCINSLMISMLFKARPDEVKFIMIDPKQVEFTMYNGIPHLLVPVVSDPKQAAGSLMWAVEEMERRYNLLYPLCVRNIDAYNEKIAQDPSLGEFLPRIVIVIDEFADLMLQVKDPVENLVMRIAQKARAAGIYLIIGTQRPSVNVITGVIKANVPSRISCKVMSNVDSKTVLDSAGAEKLLDRGDMLYAPAGALKPRRVQGAFVADGEVEAIMNFLKEQSKSEAYDSEVMEQIKRAAQKCSKKGSDSSGDDYDDGEQTHGEGYLNDRQFLDAVEVAVNTRKISTSLIQRKLSIGYGKAAKFIDIMEEKGIVGESNGQRPREVLITPDEWREMLARVTLD